MRIIVLQPAAPTYRRGLFALLAERLGNRFSVYASQLEELGALEAKHDRPAWQTDLGPIRPLVRGLEWQTGALSIPVSTDDVLVVSGEPRKLSTLILILKARLMGAHTIWWGHYWSATSKRWRAGIRFALMRLTDVIMFYTDQEVAEYCAQRKKKMRKPVLSLNNGIDTKDIKKLRAPYTPADRPRDLFFIGRITAKAEIALLLQALVRSDCEHVVLDVIGDGPGLPELRQQAANLGLADRIAWHGAIVDEAHIAKIANRCKLFVFPGSVGLSLIHGFAYGLPAIVHDDRWKHMPEIAALQPGGNGITFHRGDVASLAKAIANLLESGAELERMSAVAVATTETSFNTDDMAKRFLSAIAIVAGHIESTCGQ